MAVCYSVGETEDGGVVRDKQQILSDNRHPHPEKHKVEKKGMRLRLSSLKSDPAGEERGEGRKGAGLQCTCTLHV